MNSEATMQTAAAFLKRGRFTIFSLSKRNLAERRNAAPPPQTNISDKRISRCHKTIEFPFKMQHKVALDNIVGHELLDRAEALWLQTVIRPLAHGPILPSSRLSYSAASPRPAKRGPCDDFPLLPLQTRFVWSVLLISKPTGFPSDAQNGSRNGTKAQPCLYPGPFRRLSSFLSRRYGQRKSKYSLKLRRK